MKKALPDFRIHGIGQFEPPPWVFGCVGVLAAMWCALLVWLVVSIIRYLNTH